MTEMEESPIGYVPDYPHLAGKEERESTVQPGFRTDARGRIVDDMGRPCAGAHRNLLKQIGGDQVRPFDVTDAEAPDGGAALTKWIEACRSKFPPPPGSFTGEPSIPFECGARFFLTRWICRWLGPAWMNVGTCDDGTRLSQCSRCQGCSRYRCPLCQQTKQSHAPLWLAALVWFGSCLAALFVFRVL